MRIILTPWAPTRELEAMRGQMSRTPSVLWCALPPSGRSRCSRTWRLRRPLAPWQLAVAVANEPSPLLFARNLSAWRRWLRVHHDEDHVVWLVFLKGDEKDDGVSYGDALDEALCWGWIDSMVRRIDDRRYARKFTPRVDPEKWSDPNILRLRRLLAGDRMQPSGMALISKSVLQKVKASSAARKNTDGHPVRKKTNARIALPEELERALAENANARRFFETLAPSYRKNYVGWVAAAKQGATRARRASEAVHRLANGEKTLLK